MQYDHDPFRVLIVGQSGSGKTTFAINMLHGLKASCIFIPDTETEFQHKLRKPAGRTAAELIALIKTGWCLFDHSQMFPGEPRKGVAWFSKFAFYASHKIPGRKVYFNDELQKDAGHGELGEGFKLILDTGRRYGLDFGGISQAPNRINMVVRDQLTEVVAFKTVGKRALEYLEEMDMPSDDIKRLPRGSYIARNLLTSGESRGRVF
ncbi:MAG TPA: hypothetical protein VGH19_16080 [Verrucomicrobiae bacterium]